MNFDIEQLKKKIIYRSSYRGTKEMDKLLSAFTKKYIHKLSINDLKDLDNLLNIDDDNLYNYFRGNKTEVVFEENEINNLFKNFNYNE
tara:strand:+ start:328 stop:591 length:264 start_codon:yes stop_codon:yes gene_type:complete